MKNLKFVGRLLKKCLMLPIFLCCPTACLTRQEMQEMGIDLSGQGRE